MATVFSTVAEFARSGGCTTADGAFDPLLLSEADCLAVDGNAWDPTGLKGELPGVGANAFMNTCLLLTGAALVLLGLLQTGRFIGVVPSLVVSGFMNGIACCPGPPGAVKRP